MHKIVKRSDKLAFYGIVGEGDSVTYHRMKGFSEIATKKGAIEYSRRYVDEAFEQSDVVGYSPSISYAFDQFEDNPVHEDLVKIAEQELIGDSAVRSIIMVDMSQADDGTTEYPAIKRDFSVICDAEGNSMEAYTYSGNLKVKGEKIFGSVTSADGWETCHFTEN